MGLTDKSFYTAIEELIEAHLVLDKLGAPRVIEGDNGFVHEYLIAERLEDSARGAAVLSLVGQPQASGVEED